MEHNLIRLHSELIGVVTKLLNKQVIVGGKGPKQMSQGCLPLLKIVPRTGRGWPQLVSLTRMGTGGISAEERWSTKDTS